MRPKIFFLLALFALAFTSSLSADDRGKTVSRLQSAGTVLDEIMAAPDKGLPEEILGSAECVAVVPSLLKGGFIVGGSYGRGVATCRTSTGWSAPAFFRMEGGSVGFQIGGQAVDLIMVVMNEKGMKSLLTSKFKLGADASVAAGPVGRHAEGMTDWKMRAEVLTYSRARGVFAGISLNGAAVHQDQSSTRAFYGRMLPFKNVLSGETASPTEAWPFVGTVTKYAGVRQAAKPAEAQAKPAGTQAVPPPPPPPPPAEAKPAETTPAAQNGEPKPEAQPQQDQPKK
ncbi:MAG: lipid-binding SYLF domain-containing protein [Acidobacteriales bacterium]|nr:lipid-binding SYLF domain-containing protein [Terriglobales bacterium]